MSLVLKYHAFLLYNYTTNSDKSKAQQRFLDPDPKKDPRLQGTNVVKNIVVQGNNPMAKIKPSGSEDQVRINLYAGNASDFKGFQANAHTIPNQNTVSQNGYMFKPNDWCNVEITEMLKSINLDQAIAMEENTLNYRQGEGATWK